MFPELDHIGSLPLPFPIHMFGLMVVLGFGAGMMLAARLARERGLPGDALLDAAVSILFASVAGARLLFVLLNFGHYARHPVSVLYLWEGGMSFHGGLAGGLLAGLLHLRKHRLPVLAIADAAAPGLALGYAIGRIGCLLNGCCYGGPTTLPWGLHFPHTPNPELCYHPAQVYASVINLGVMGLLIAAYRKPHRVGQVLAAYIGLYSVYRFFIECLRKGVTADVLAFGLTQAQVFSLFAIAAAAAWWFWLRANAPAAPEPVPPAPTPVPAPSSE